MQRRYPSAMVPYKRRSYRPIRKYGAKRRTYFRGRKAPMYRAPAFAAAVRRVVSAEQKYKVDDQLFSSSRFTGGFNIMTNVQQGVLATERIGNWLQATSTHGTVVVHGNGDALPLETYGVRVWIMVLNEDFDQIVPVNASGYLLTDTRPAGPFNILRKGEFSVLWTRYVQVSNNTDNSLFTRTLPFRLSLNKVKKSLYDGTDIKKYHLFFMTTSDAAVDANLPLVQLDYMMRYTDS